MRYLHSLAILFAVSCLTAGCSIENSKVAVLRSQFVVGNEPADAVTLTKAKSLLAEETDIVLVGMIGSGKLDPFEKGKAIFVLSEAPTGEHGDEDGHDSSECPFCKRRAAEAPIATIEFKDSSGNPLATSADKLFGLSKGQVVVVQGRGIYSTELDAIQLTANKLFVRKGK